MTIIIGLVADCIFLACTLPLTLSYGERERFCLLLLYFQCSCVGRGDLLRRRPAGLLLRDGLVSSMIQH